MINEFEKLIGTAFAKRLLVAAIIGLAVTGHVSMYARATQEDIADSVIRLHVLAASDSEADRQLKLKVRDGVLAVLENKLGNAESSDDTLRIINENISEIEAAAKAVLKENGSAHDAVCMTGVYAFPTKSYGKSRLPAGEYRALRVVIGGGAGENWWCVLYPRLCFSGFDEQSKKKLKNVLTDDEYKIVTDSDGSIEYRLKFRVLELFGK